MAVEFLEGFDNIGTGNGQLTAKGWNVGGFFGTSASGRFGRGASLSNGSMTRDLSGNRSSVWIGFAFQLNGLAASQIQFLDLVDSVGGTNSSRHLGLAFNPDDTVVLQRGATTLSTSRVLTTNVWYYFELYALFHATAGAYEFRIDGVTAFSGSGISTLSGTANPYINRLKWYSPGSGGAGLISYIVDDMYVLNSLTGLSGFQGDCRVYSFTPNGEGATQNFTPNSGAAHYSRVNENGADGDTSYVASATVGDIDLFTLAALPSTVGSVLAVQHSSYVRKDDVGTRIAQHVVRSGGVNYDQAATFGLSTSYQSFPEIYEADPTGAAWTRAAFNAAQFGVKVNT